MDKRMHSIIIYSYLYLQYSDNLLFTGFYNLMTEYEELPGFTLHIFFFAHCCVRYVAPLAIQA